MTTEWIYILALIYSVNAAGQVLATNQSQPADFPNTKDLNDTIQLEDVTVSVLQFRESYMEATGGVFSLQTTDVDLKFSFNSTELFNMAPGIHMASGTYNTNRMVIRGIGSRTPYNTNRIKAYLDDIPLTSGDGISTLEDMDLYGTGNIEILKGPSSGLYGSGLGGVVKLNSPYPRTDGFSARISGEAGSFNTIRYGLSSSYKSGKMAASGGVTRSMTDGYRENSQYSRTSAFLNTRYFSKRNTLSFTFSLIDLFSRIPSSVNETDFINHPERAGGNWLNIKGYEEYIKILAGIKLESQLGNKLTNHLMLFSSYTNPYESRPFNILNDRSSSLGLKEYLQYNMKSIRFSAGLEYFHEWYDWQIFETLMGLEGSLLSDHSEVRRYANAFALVQWRHWDRLLIDGGINLNLLQYYIQTNYQIDASDQSGSYSYPVILSPRIGISIMHHKDLFSYTSVGHGFSAPSLEETLLPEGMINTELKPETGWNIEIGNRGNFSAGRIRYDVALYTIFLDNLLVTERIAEDIFTGANAGKAVNSGLECWMQVSLFQPGDEHTYNASTTIGYTVSRNRFIEFLDDGIDYSGNSLPGIPTQKLNSLVSGSYGPVEMKLHYQYMGSQWMNDANDEKNNPYQLLHLQASWKYNFLSIPFGCEFHGGIRNLFNTRYASMILVNAPSFGGNPPRYYYPGLPRQFHLGITLKYH